MKGVRRDRYGLRAYVKVSGVQRERRFPRGTSAETIKRWRDDMRAQLRKAVPSKAEAGSLAADIARYLHLVRSMPTYEERERHLKLWQAKLGAHTPRALLRDTDIARVLQDWHDAGLEPATLNKRRTALMHVWTKLDGKGASNPVRNVPKFPVPDPLPRGRDPHRLDRAFKAMPRCATRARFRVMLWTGMRPAELMRAEPEDLDLRRRQVIVRTAKGGRTRTVPLTPDAVDAWREFEAMDAWGAFTLAPANRMLKAATGIPSLRVYDLRHSYGTALALRQVRLDAIGALMGHSTLELTRRYTLAAVLPEALGATKKLAVAAGSGRKRS